MTWKSTRKTEPVKYMHTSYIYIYIKLTDFKELAYAVVGSGLASLISMEQASNLEPLGQLLTLQSARGISSSSRKPQFSYQVIQIIR